MEESQIVSFEDFKNEWLQEIIANNPTTVEIGSRFSKKLITHWLDLDDDNDEIIYCDGSGDGGIDIAYLKRSENESEGDIWYLVQSKYGSSFNGRNTLLIEGQKVIETIDGKTHRLSSIGKDVFERLMTFKESRSTNDKMVLIFATSNSISEDEKRALDDIKAMGKNRLGDFFDTDSISIETIYQRVSEKHIKYRIPFSANLVLSGNDLLVGSIKLNNLYQFLKDYKSETRDIDLIYEKNVRKFLGPGKINKEIAKTLKENPERFGLYNNGITIVVDDFQLIETDKFILVEPFIVNGCQTTRTIWDYLSIKLESGGNGINSELEEYKNKLKKGIVVVKVVKVGENGNELLTETTRFTNSQNAVGKKDFIALERDFRTWADEMKKLYKIYLEIQRGGSESTKVLEKRKSNSEKYVDYVNAFELLKIYGAAWLNEPGTAFGQNAAFAPPNGSIFKQIVEKGEFNVNDLYACYLLQQITTKKIKFGRTTEKENQETRGKTRFLFYHVLTELLKDCMNYSKIQNTNPNLTLAFISIFNNVDSLAANKLIEAAIGVIDEYMTKGNEDSVFNEPHYLRLNDMNHYMKYDKLGKGSNYTPKLSDLITFAKKDLKRQNSGQKIARDIICEALINSNITNKIKQRIEEKQVGLIYFIENQNKQAFARGYFNDNDLFVVLAGSKISERTTPSISTSNERIRNKCFNDGTIQNFTFTKDFEFNSWSAAAGVVLGINASGPDSWKLEQID